MRLPNDESRIDGRAFEIERARRAEAHSGESEVGAGREAGARREEVPLDAERKRDGLRENGRRNSEVRRGCGEAGKIRGEQVRLKDSGFRFKSMCSLNAICSGSCTLRPVHFFCLTLS